MKRTSRKSATATQRRATPAKDGPLSSQMQKALALIRARPGIRPSELNRLMRIAQSDSLRAALIRRGLIRKEQDGLAMRYYPND